MTNEEIFELMESREIEEELLRKIISFAERSGEMEGMLKEKMNQLNRTLSEE